MENSPSNLDRVELHTDSKDGALLGVVGLAARTEHGAEVEVLDLLLVLVDEVAPLLLSCLALHLVLVYGGRRIEVREFLLEVLVDLVVELGQAKLGAGHLLENVPVCLHVLDDLAILSASSSDPTPNIDIPLTANCFSMSSKLSACSAEICAPGGPRDMLEMRGYARGIKGIQRAMDVVGIAGRRVKCAWAQETVILNFESARKLRHRPRHTATLGRARG